MKDAVIEMRIILVMHSSRLTDHIITITAMQNKYIWDYNDGTVSTHHLVELSTYDDVLTQFDLLVQGLTCHVDPYRRLQFNVPAFPPIVLDIKNLCTSAYSLREMLKNALVHLPKAMTPEEVVTYMKIGDHSKKDNSDEDEDKDDGVKDDGVKDDCDEADDEDSNDDDCDDDCDKDECVTYDDDYDEKNDKDEIAEGWHIYPPTETKSVSALVEEDNDKYNLKNVMDEVIERWHIHCPVVPAKEENKPNDKVDNSIILSKNEYADMPPLIPLLTTSPPVHSYYTREYERFKNESQYSYFS